LLAARAVDGGPRALVKTRHHIGMWQPCWCHRPAADAVL